MGEGSFAKTASRSVVGVMNEFAFLARVHRDHHGAEVGLIALSLFVVSTGPSSGLNDEGPGGPKTGADLGLCAESG